MPDSYAEPAPAGPVARLLSAIRNRRAKKRLMRQSRIFLFSETEFLSPAILVDESEDGAAIWAPSSKAVAAARYALDHVTGEVRTLDPAWRSGKRAGFRYVEKRQLDVFNPEGKVEHVRAFWAKMAAPRFH